MTEPTKKTAIGAGVGKYDDLATMVRERTGATGIVLLVHRGNLGEGFAVQFTDPMFLIDLPATLRTIAASIEADQESLALEMNAKSGGST